MDHPGKIMTNNDISGFFNVEIWGERQTRQIGERYLNICQFGAN